MVYFAGDAVRFYIGLLQSPLTNPAECVIASEACMQAVDFATALLSRETGFCFVPTTFVLRRQSSIKGKNAKALSSYDRALGFDCLDGADEIAYTEDGYF